MTFAPVRLSLLEVTDLKWLLLEDHKGDLGMRSNLGATLARAERLANGTPGWSHPQAIHLRSEASSATAMSYEPTEAALGSATRLRRLERRWGALAQAHRLTLRLWLGIVIEDGARCVRHALPEWGELGSLVFESTVARRLHAKASGRGDLVSWLAKLPARSSVSVVAIICAIRRDAETRLLAACRAWEATYDAGRRHRPTNAHARA